MAAAVRLRLDFDGAELRRLTRISRDARRVRRLLALAAIYEGPAGGGLEHLPMQPFGPHQHLDRI